MKRGAPPKDPRGGHIRLYWSILDSPAWRTLTHADVRVYLAMRRKLKQTNNGDINATLAEMRHAGISSSSTLSTALHRLEALGLIEKTRQGGIAQGGKLCSLYRFTDEHTYDIAKAGVRSGPPSNEWQRFKNLAEARAAVRQFTRKNKVKLRPSERSDATIEAVKDSSGSTNKQEAVSLMRLSKRRQEAGNPLQAA